MCSMLHFHWEVISLHHIYGPLVQELHWCTVQVLTQALEDMDLTAAQGRILGLLAHRKDPPCPRDIEEAFHLSHPTVSGLLSRLEQKGFIELRTDPNDRRCKRIYVLPKGAECHDLMHQVFQSSEQRIVQGFTPEEQTQFTAYLQRAITNMGGSPNQNHPKEEKRE